MKRMFFTSLTLSVSFLSFSQYHYPVTPVVPVIDNYFGTTVTDNYRWLENIKDSAVVKWFKSQSDFTNNVLSKIPGQQILITEMETLDSVQKIIYGLPSLANHTFFFEKRMPGEPIGKIFSRPESGGADRLLFDPMNYIPGKAMNVNFNVSKNGKYLLLNVSEAGKEIPNIRIIDIKSGKTLKDEIAFADGSFLPADENIIVYSKYKNDDVHDFQNNMNTKFMLHVIGTDISTDKEILSRAKYPELEFDSSDYPVIQFFAKSNFMFAEKGSSNRNLNTFYAPVSSLQQNKIAWQPFSIDADEIKSITSRGNDVFCLTSKGNNNGSVVKVSLPNPDFSKAIVIAKGYQDWTINNIFQANDYLIVRLVKNGIENKNLRYDFQTGKLDEITIPVQGTMFVVPYSSRSNKSFVLNTSWTEPMNIYQYNISENYFSTGPFYVPADYPGIKNIAVKEVEVPSYDGTMVPLSIVYDKTKLKNDASNICLLEGYGAYGMSTPPYFDQNRLPLLTRGVVYAWAHVRGGGERGEAWHLGGFKNTKKNTWKDFNACADYLINNKFTAPERLSCSSGSAGGILIGNAIIERPELYKVAIPKVGVLNALRSEETPNGPVNVPEFGTVNDSTECAGLLQMDALHKIKQGVSYPAMLITTGFNDPRVTSWEPGKFAAAMQAVNKSSTPTLLFVDYKAGHFGGSTVKEQIAENAMMYAFLLWQCGHPEFQMNDMETSMSEEGWFEHYIEYEINAKN